MSVQRRTFFVDGMSCPACESKISKSLLAIHGVVRVEARVNGGPVVVEFDDARVDQAAIKAAIENAGYAVRERKDAGTIVALGVGLLLAAAYLTATAGGLFNALPAVDASMGYAMLFVVGLLTSIHCVAMCGGIALSQSIRPLETGPAAATENAFTRFKPGLMYNAGRITSYTVIGGIAGALGAAFSFSPTVKGIITGAAGAFMVILGLGMLGILKNLPRLGSIVPSRVRESGSFLAARFRSKGPFAVGLLNGLMPCGPLQTMQLYALGTGSMISGALSMLVFSAGTVPLMLVFSLTAAFLPRKFLPVMVRASAVLVVFLGVVTFGRAASLAGLALPSLQASGLSARSPVASRSARQLPVFQVADRVPVKADRVTATIEGGIQSVVTEFKSSSYVPFTVQAGVPLRWTIRIKAEDLNGCNNPVVIPAYGIKKTLVAGDNLIEFTPLKEGTIAYSCWMGMIRSRITVVRDLGTKTTAQLDKIEPFELPGEGLGLGSCCTAPIASLRQDGASTP